MNDQENSLFHNILENIGYYNLEMNIWQRIGIVAGIILLAVILFYACRLIIMPVIRKITDKTSITWDDHLFNQQVTNSICHIIPPLVLYTLIPLAFNEEGQEGPLFNLVMRIIQVYLIAVIIKLFNSFLNSLYKISNENSTLRNKPLKGIYQMLKIVVISIGVIVIISVIFDKDPATLLTGIGASAAIIMLVFKDTIMGLVAGVQLSANDMLRPGDWIVMNKYGADGTVIEVTLNTVKVQNWDKTIVTLPPYLLVSDSFQNWRGMEESGGRRIARSIPVDMTSVRFCSDTEIEQYRAKGWLRRREGDTDIVNLAVLRSYIEGYLLANENINSNMIIMVRQLEPTANGLPLQIYCFSNQKSLKAYEAIQAEVIEHIIAMMPKFGLRVFQSPTGADLRQITGR